MTDNVDNSEFRAWIEQTLKPRALDMQIRARVFSRATAEVTFLPEVLEHQANQKEFDLPIWEYLEIAASDERARNGRQQVRRHRELLNRIEMAFGVEPEVIAAIWGLETGYGAVRGKMPVLSSLATLAFRGRRARYLEDELMAAMRLIQTMGCKPGDFVGSWAGALGHGQFMPTAVIDFGVDFDGDGKLQLCADDPTDALASIANYLKKHNWKKGQPWGLEVRLPERFDFAFAGLDQTLATRDWNAMGVTGVDGGPVPDYGFGSILLPAGARGVALLVLRNFHVIMRYNKAEAYAIGVGLLSDRILGGKPFCADWPLDDPILARSDVGEVQYLLTLAGYDTFGVDGMRGPNTLKAVRAWQAANGRVPDGYINAALLEALRAK